MFPYLTGLLFVESVRRSQPWSKIDEVFKSPPESTEQVMHPGKVRGPRASDEDHAGAAAVARHAQRGRAATSSASWS